MLINILKSQKTNGSLATSILKTEKKEQELKQIPCIWYFVIFKNKTKAILDSKSKVNVMNLVFTLQLDLKIQKTNVGIQKIDDIILKIYGMVISIFFVSDKDGN